MSRFIEEITLNTWPAQQSLLLNGWLLRYASGYTKRANSVSPLYFPTDGDVFQNIQLAEEHYSKLNQKTIFKITPYVDPKELENILEKQGYTVLDPSAVMTMDLEHINQPTINTVKMNQQVETGWLDLFASFSNMSNKNKVITKNMLTGSTLKQAFATLYHSNAPVACGIAVIQHDYVGLYDIVTHERHRRQGFGEQLILNLLMWAKRNGAKQSFTQVVQANQPAINLYQKLGYKDIYPYWYRVKETTK